MSTPHAFQLRCMHGIGYEEALALQTDALERLRVDPDSPGLLLCVEHTPLVTMGRGGSEENLLAGRDGLAAAGVAYHESRRGGDITYHGPGQITLYPVFPLDWWKRDLHAYMRLLEEAGIAFLREHGLAGRREPGRTGVWVGEEKIAAIGIAVRHWIAYHGLAMNIAPGMDHFALIRPCGIADRGVTSLSRLTGRTYAMAEEMTRMARAFVSVLGNAILLEPDE